MSLKELIFFLLVSHLLFCRNLEIYYSSKVAAASFFFLAYQVKPGLPYLDIIRLLRDKSPLPIAAYQVLRCSFSLFVIILFISNQRFYKCLH